MTNADGNMIQPIWVFEFRFAPVMGAPSSHCSQLNTRAVVSGVRGNGIVLVESQSIGTFMVVAVLFVVIEGVLRACSIARGRRATGSGRAQPEH